MICDFSYSLIASPCHSIVIVLYTYTLQIRFREAWTFILWKESWHYTFITEFA